MTEVPTILVVDDVPQNVRLLEAVLTANGFAVASASSGPKALEQVRTETPTSSCWTSRCGE